MCEFKIIRENDETQIAEEILVLNYNNENELLLRDVLGSGEIVNSALILDVNTLDQTCKIIEHPIVNPFIQMMKGLASGDPDKESIRKVKEELEKIESTL